MGQCPMSPPSYTDDDLDDTGTIPIMSETASANSMPFLVEHSFDDPDRSILDQSDILDSLEYQASIDDKLRKEKESQQQTVEIPKVVSPPKSPEELFSSAPTEATRKISNVDRIAPKEKFRARSEAKRTSGMSGGYRPMGDITEGKAMDDRSLRDRRSFCTDGSIVEHEQLVEFDAMDPQKKGKRKGGIMSEYYSKYQSHITYDDQSDVSGLKSETQSTQAQARCLHPLSPSACLTGVYGKVRGERTIDTSSKVLDLKMEANLIGFYRREYLRRFPDSPQPEGMAKVSQSNRDKGSKLKDYTILRPIMYAVDDSPYLDLVLTGSLGLVDLQKSSAGYEKNYLVLKNAKTDMPLAICALKSPHEAPIARIYATKQRVNGQAPAASSTDIGLSGVEVDLYAWAEFATEGEFPNPVRYSIYLSSGADGKYEKEPSYKGSHIMPGSPEISFVGRTNKEMIYRGCCLLSVYSDESNDEEAFFRTSLSRGVDPALFICFSAIIDEIVEASMRKRCKKKSRGKRRY